MPQFTCSCGVEFTARRPNAKYCSDRCRKRVKRSGADVVPIEKAESPPDGDDVLADCGPIETATVLELRKAERLDTPLGWTVVALAHRLDRGFVETGSAYAALSREFERTLSLATRGAGAATAPQTLTDELAERRSRHGA